MKKLTRLVYTSRIRPEIEANLPLEVGRILQVSRANNRHAGVTGMLLTYAGHFVQALEGEDGPVRSTLSRVNADPRHSAVTVLGSEFISRRAFGRWSMCANRLSSADDDILKVLDGRGVFEPYRLKPMDAFRLLKTIADIQARRLEAAGEAA